MSFVLFKDKKKPVEVQVKKLNMNLIEITGCVANTSGFTIFKDEEMKYRLGSYEDFTTLYQELDESFILSNDGSFEFEREPTLREIVENMNKDLENTQESNANVVEELTSLQLAVTEIYEMVLSMME